MRNRGAALIVQIVAVLGLSTVAFSQDHVPVIQDNTPVVLEQKPAPRTSSGKPDLSGVWAVPSTDEAKILAARFGTEKPESPSLTPWAEERFEYNQDTRKVPGYDPTNHLSSSRGSTYGSRLELNPFYKCSPPGLAYIITGWGSISPQEIMQNDKRVFIFYEYDHTVRQIWTDGSKHPEQVDPSWMGNSIGTWDGDTLVVDTVGLINGERQVWLDGAGHVASDGLHIVERYRRIDNDTLQIDFTYDDPKAFTKPWTRREFRRLRPTWKLIEDVRCYPGSPDLKVPRRKVRRTVHTAVEGAFVSTSKRCQEIPAVIGVLRMPVCRAIQMSALAKGMLHFTWLWPATESLHLVAMAVLVTSITTFDLRLTGLAFRRVRVSELGDRLLPATWGAFAVMILTGTLLFAPSAANKYCANPAFHIKLILILLAGINMSVFHFTVYRNVSKWDESASTPLLARVVGTVSVLLWASVVVAGRFIGFT